ncbi:hypothetical protein FB384_002306 [Prauserella sediminis]|uniref:DUF3159 domain-containing protein n=1 Tax=Prauserella sediminis TaxID=577680 RepID=A0A839XHF6_9PSEU|nr:hypothetical protein [Prauserella sediminis]
MSDTPPHEPPGEVPPRREQAPHTDAAERSEQAPQRGTDRRRESLASLLGGRKGAIDASLPPVAFVVGWLVSGSSIGWGAAAAIALSVVIGCFRLARGDKVRAVLISLAAVVLAALIALRTGRAQDFFLIQLLSNVASALAWAVSIAIRWPLLGVVVGTVLGQKTRWRSDPDLLRAYSRASWVWVFGQYTLRIAVFGVLWWAGEVVALGVARTVLSWPLVALTVGVSGWVLHRSLPAEHPGLRHPVPPAAREAGASDGDPADGESSDAPGQSHKESGRSCGDTGTSTEATEGRAADAIDSDASPGGTNARSAPPGCDR